MLGIYIVKVRYTISYNTSHGRRFLFSSFSFILHLHVMLTRALYINHRYQYRYLPADKNPHLFLLYHSCIGLTLQTTCRISFLICWNIPDSLNNRLPSIGRHYQMYVTVIQKVSVPPEVLVSLFDGYKSLAPIELLRFFLRILLLTTILLCIKNEHLWYAYILGNRYQPRHWPSWCLSEMEINRHRTW